jgi:transglutaminase-like putative cysteine protease
VLLYHTELTRPGDTLTNFYNEVKQSSPNEILPRIQHFSSAVNKCLRYERGVTANSTAAQDAFNRGAGVCQDYAHILLALLRMDKIPCRYIAGLASDYGETHAWVEAQISKEQFCGIDPTRDKLIDDNYIALSWGLDFKDCSVERGVFKGACRGTQTINLKMEVSQ